MLIQFKLSNFRSVGEEQVLSLVPATNQKEFPNNIIEDDGHIALNLAALYGANGSGKSNILKAIGKFLSMIKDSGKFSSTDKLDFDPFLLREGWSDKSTAFEMIFSLNEHRYRYGFSYDATHILKEWLFRKTIGREVNVFQRERDVIDPSSSLKANSKIIDAAIEATRDNSLFLATLDMFNVAEASTIFEYFQGNVMIEGHQSYNYGQLGSVWENAEIKTQVKDHMKRLKLGLVDLEGQKEEVSKQSAIYDPEYQVMAKHKFYDKNGQPTEKIISWDFLERESSGSIKALELSAPINVLLRLGGVLVIDEIEAKLHPLLTLDTINLFLNKETNPNNAQLIFSTHDTNLLSYANLRRDQIYFAEKNNWESTEIYSLSDFVYINDNDSTKYKERPDTDKEKRYIEGRYGAIPVLGLLANLERTNNG